MNQISIDRKGEYLASCSDDGKVKTVTYCCFVIPLFLIVLVCFVSRVSCHFVVSENIIASYFTIVYQLQNLMESSMSAI